MLSDFLKHGQFSEELYQLLLRYIQDFNKACQAKNVSLPDSKFWSPLLLKVWGTSDFVAAFSVEHPEKLLELIESGDLKTSHSPGTYFKRLAEYPPLPLARQLREFRKREMVRIAWRDILGWADLRETLLDTSQLADACIQFSVAALYTQFRERFGIPYGENRGPQSLIVLALGKLGGQELNFSSDVDLIFAYAEEGTTQGTPTSIPNQVFFLQLAQALVKVLDDITEDGFVFRVDLRLRPFGEEGPIVMNFEGLENYYAASGREWERYALIKARPITGSESEKAAVRKLLKPFVYRKYIDFSVLTAIRSLKKTIAEEVKRKKLDQNLKLGAGGIREIEFTVQSLQLIYGGRRPELQTCSIYEAFQALEAEGLLDKESIKVLQNAYGFLRTLENRLQEMQDRQTHILPDDELAKERLCLSFGAESWDSFYTQLQTHRQKVHSHFLESITPKEEETIEEPLLLSLALFWKESLDEETAMQVLSDLGFKRVDAAKQGLDALKRCARSRTQSASSVKNVELFIPKLLLKVGKTDDPDTTLQRVSPVLEAMFRRTVYLVLLLENPGALSTWVNLCAKSAWLADQLALMPMLLDELLDTRQLYQVTSKRSLQAEIGRKLAPFQHANDEEIWQNRIVEFRQSHFFRVGATELMKKINARAAGKVLSDLAEVVLDQVLEHAWRSLLGRYGKPEMLNRGQKGVAMIAYGKLGGCDLGYTSDLDVVFLCEDKAVEGFTDGPQKISSAEFYHRLVQKILHACHCVTPAGFLYKLDMRLRPSGVGLPLVTVSSFSHYQERSAALWEHQALIKARLICGNKGLQQKFFAIRQNIILRERQKEALSKEICAMRAKMLTHLNKSSGDFFDLKQGEGGLVDIEFIVQYGVLAWGTKYPLLVRRTETVRLLSLFAQTGLMSTLQVKYLIKAYLTYLHMLHRLMLNQMQPLVPLSSVEKIRARVREVWEELIIRS